ncbi:BirA family biotin operon repressor/biotin-[acetyl-CoA-carboxylase] ligase [Arcanobacterium wilhelmae]|uniref:BirA family biotin operon repressor/biotin-[acetyl-CoA-carboxylase] ligase n=1 Tax=Arcanobacterium wilhelmae TaxID=1803177 RepID=A0ABT9NCK5_9ACTO|nr:biotin--[acetyl-CoA-carboxylase] ligase [Arcanobacterium wilhelmae]MDP9801455.1 BirA family biotin operon repressor/biotin-[acetyl-CoA-carboxylase] ligase [Arcanobacterium wilhelmae]WFN90788.1 biotin--[acetyl-CoA-carboxylase] ligase [Arcanobacterium wilhelmae]
MTYEPVANSAASALASAQLYTPVTGSTQDDARAWYVREDIPSLTVLSAGHQTAGRGRVGRTWEDRPDAGVLSTIVLTVPDTPENRDEIGWLTLMVAIAARAAVAETGGESAVAEIKWPNDIVINREACRDAHRHFKIGGILGELLGVRGGVITCAIGVGINVNQGIGEIPQLATSMRLAFGPHTLGAADAVLAGILRRLRGMLPAWISGGAGRNAELRAELTAHSADLNHAVTVRFADGEEVAGYAREISADGSLQLDTPSGPVAITPADVAMFAAEEWENE